MLMTSCGMTCASHSHVSVFFWLFSPGGVGFHCTDPHDVHFLTPNNYGKATDVSYSPNSHTALWAARLGHAEADGLREALQRHEVSCIPSKNAH